MLRKMVFVGLAVSAIVSAVAACAGPIGKAEGDSCKTSDDCEDGLVCQPVADKGPYCCPTPPSSSKKSSCNGS
jgi:hypothetical protein